MNKFDDAEREARSGFRSPAPGAPSRLGVWAKWVGGCAVLAALGAVGAGMVPLGGKTARAQATPESGGVRPAPTVLPPTPSRASPSAALEASPAGGADPSSDSSASADAAPQGLTADGKVILNLAGQVALMRLPGIGASRAKAILELRTRLKRFGRVEDLLRVKGLGRKRLARLRPLVVLDPPTVAPVTVSAMSTP